MVGRPNVVYCFVANLTDFPAVKEAEESISTGTSWSLNTLNDILENKQKIFTYRYIWLWSMPSSKLFKWHTVWQKSEVDEEIQLSDKSLSIWLIGQMQVITTGHLQLLQSGPRTLNSQKWSGTCPWIYGSGASETQCKGDISHASETTKITVFDPVICKSPDAPLQLWRAALLNICNTRW